MIVKVPIEYQCKHPMVYPSDNVLEFERWFHLNFKPERGWPRKYLPIYWTNYYCKHNWGKDRRAISRLQNYLATIPREKYFTICQMDDGILNDLSDLDIRIYGMSKGFHYPLPLICMPHAPARVRGQIREYQACFIGSINHPIRSELMKFEHQKGWYMSKRVHNMPAFCNIMNQSVFALCPRGYGPTSFRIMEALQYGAIPVYISDEFVIPHNKDFSEYGILVKPDQIKRIPEILKAADIKKLQEAGEYIYRNYYTYQANLELIHKDLQHG